MPDTLLAGSLDHDSTTVKKDVPLPDNIRADSPDWSARPQPSNQTFDTSTSPACDDCRVKHRKCPHRAAIPLPKNLHRHDTHIDRKVHASKPAPIRKTTFTASGKRRGRPPKWLIEQRKLAAKEVVTDDSKSVKADEWYVTTERYRPRKRRPIDDYEYSQKFEKVILNKVTDSESDASEPTVYVKGKKVRGPAVKEETRDKDVASETQESSQDSAASYEPVDSGPTSYLYIPSTVNNSKSYELEALRGPYKFGVMPDFPISSVREGAMSISAP